MYTYFIFGHVQVLSSHFVDNAALNTVTVFVLCLYFNVLLSCFPNLYEYEYLINFRKIR